jgi:hypothetical protein
MKMSKHKPKRLDQEVNLPIIALLMVGTFFLPFIVFRSWSVSYTLDEPFLAIMGQHFHHWMVGVVLFPVFLILYWVEYRRPCRKNNIIIFLLLCLSFITGMIIDGMIGYTTWFN